MSRHLPDAAPPATGPGAPAKPSPAARRGVYTIDAIALAVCALLTIGAFVVGLQPILDRRADAADLRQRIGEQRRQAERLADLAARLRRALADVELAAERDRIDLRPTARVNRLVAEVADLAASVGLRIDEVQPGEARPGDRYHTVPIRIAGSGRYPGAAAFLHHLRHASPDVAVASFELIGRPHDPDAPADFRFALTWHAAPE